MLKLDNYLKNDLLPGMISKLNSISFVFSYRCRNVLHSDIDIYPYLVYQVR